MLSGREDGCGGVVVCGCHGDGRDGGGACGCAKRVQEVVMEWS